MSGVLLNSPSEKHLDSVLFLEPLGGGLNGAIIGTFIKTDRWKEVPLDVCEFTVTGEHTV